MVPETQEAIAAAMRAKLTTLDARLATDAADLDDEGRALIATLRHAAEELAQAIEETEGKQT